jgi:hypothetical protein
MGITRIEKRMALEHESEFLYEAPYLELSISLRIDTIATANVWHSSASAFAEFT